MEIDFPPTHLTFGSWDEIKDEIHACFFSFEKTEVADPSSSFLHALRFIKDLNLNPSDHTMASYTCGLAAYDVWISGVEKWYGVEHGN